MLDSRELVDNAITYFIIYGVVNKSVSNLGAMAKVDSTALSKNSFDCIKSAAVQKGGK